MKHSLKLTTTKLLNVNKIFTKNYSWGCTDFQRYIPVTVDHTVV